MLSRRDVSSDDFSLPVQPWEFCPSPWCSHSLIHQFTVVHTPKPGDPKFNYLRRFHSFTMSWTDTGWSPLLIVLYTLQVPTCQKWAPYISLQSYSWHCLLMDTSAPRYLIQTDRDRLGHIFLQPFPSLHNTRACLSPACNSSGAHSHLFILVCCQFGF